MSTGLDGYLMRASTRAPLIGIVVEIRKVTDNTVTTTATTSTQGFFTASGLANAVYVAAPRITGTDWAIQPALDYYTAGGTDVALADGGTGASLTDPNADRIFFWDDSAGTTDWLAPGNSVAITGTTLDTIQDIRTSAIPTFAGLTNSVASAGGTAEISQINTDNTNAASHAWLRIRSGGSSAGDPMLRWDITGVKTWLEGIDNSDTDALVVSEGATLGTNNRLKFTAATTTAGADLTMQADQLGAWTGLSTIQRVLTISQTTPANSGVVVPSTLTINSGITLTIGSGAEVRVL